MSKEISKSIIISLLILYIIFSYTFEWGADFVSPLYNIFIFYVMITSIKDKQRFKSNYSFIAYAILLWGLLDIAWFVLAQFTSIDPNESDLIDLIYIIPNILLMISALSYFIKNMKKWNIFQLVVDAMTVLVIVLGMSSGLIFTLFPESQLTFTESFIITAYTITDVVTLTVLLVMLASSRISHISSAIRYVTVGYLLYLASDFIYIIDDLKGSYIPNSISDILFLGSFLHFAFSTLKTEKNSLGPLEEQPDNFGKSNIVYYVVLFAFILAVLDQIEWIYILIFFVVLVLYLIFNKFAQNFISSEILLKHEKEIKNKLEELVEARTKELRKSRDELRRKTITDSLTGLFNRDYFYQIADEKIFEKKPFSIIYGDLNRFKIINDLHGHQMGDDVLTVISKRLSQNIPIQNDLFRVGGDEFVIIVNSEDLDVINETVSSFIEFVTQPIEIHDYRFNLDISIGISRYPRDGKEISALVKHADIAMYHAKSLEAKHVVFSRHMLDKIERRNKIELLLKSAVMKDEFQLYYQAQIDTKTQKILGMEALIRWFHPTEGFISPGEFIPIAEEVGLITDISYWVFEEAMKQIKTWNHKYNQNLSMAMNMSAVTINNIHFFDNVRDLIQNIGVNPEHLEFEITEHSAMSSSTIMEEVFAHLSGLGVKVAIDDFGTGYSSLSYLKRFDVDRLKIAKELIDNIAIDPDDHHIVKAITMMANGMGLKTVGEGVETQEQFDILNQLNCDVIQGYFFSTPMNSKDFEASFLTEDKL